VLQAAMDDAGFVPVDGEIENTYRVLTDDDVSAGMRAQQRNQLEREGIDVESVEDDFVTHQAVYTYLTEVYEVSKESADRDDVEKHRQRINRLRGRTEAVTLDSLESLASNGEIALGDHNAIIDIQVYCQDCGVQTDILSLLEDGGCNCPVE
jgi:hypothetical protein